MSGATAEADRRHRQSVDLLAPPEGPMI